MLWYFNNQQCYSYPSNELINNALSAKFIESIYGDSNITDLPYALTYMQENNIDDLSVILPIDVLSVNYGNANDINKDFCDQKHIHYRYENRSGGCMVFFPGNIIIHSVYSGTTFLKQHHYLNDLVIYLKNKNIIATTNNNDLLVGGLKAVGTVSEILPTPYEGKIYFAVQISINADADLISKICKKPAKKIPGALSNYNITTEEIMQFTLDWFNTYEE